VYDIFMRINEPFRQLLLEAKTFYDSVEKVYCPALNAEVIFNSDGFHHLRYNSSRSQRSKPEQRNKLAYLKEAVEVLKKSSTVQDYRECYRPLGTPDRSGFRKMVRVEFFAFWAVIGDVKKMIRIRVVVRRINGVQYHFWSDWPYWKEKIINGQKVKFLASDSIEDE
jgi:hypothetical protein